MHHRRETLLKLIEERPGRTFRSLVRLSGIPAGTTRHHLNMLIRRDLIWYEPLAETLCHFPGPRPSNPDIIKDMMQFGLCDAHQKMLRFVKANGPIRQKELIIAFGDVSRGTTQHRVNRLVDLGFLEVRRAARSKFYS